MALNIFIDESGYTGGNLLDQAQPVFALASIALPDDITAQLVTAHFTGVQAAELKHSRLAKYASGRRRVVEFVRKLNLLTNDLGRPVASAFVVHKKFSLLALAVDLWVEPAAEIGGIDLYKDGANLALANVAFAVLELVPDFFTLFLKAFDHMMRERSADSYHKFWKLVDNAYRKPCEITGQQKIQRMVKKVIIAFLAARKVLSLDYLIGLPQHALDIAMSTITATVHHWSNQTKESLRLNLDESKYYADFEWIWKEITRPDLPRASFSGPNDFQLSYPLNIEATIPADSKAFHQLQFADIISGAVAECIRNSIEPETDSTYADELRDAGICNFLIRTVWPSSNVTPEEMGTSQMSGKHLAYLLDQVHCNPNAPVD